MFDYHRMSSTAVTLGRTWFRWRGLSPLPFFLLMFVLPPQFALSGVQLVMVLAAMLACEALRGSAVGYAGSVTRTRGDTVSELVHAGPFRYVRNPLYLANISLYTLTGILFGFWELSWVLFLYSCVQYHFIVQFEESVLTETFGKRYEEYLVRVPRWFPRFVAGIPSSPHRFSLNRSLASERSTLWQIVLVLLVYVLKKRFLYN
jgi:protein-S-isoprenylcysteine O-methyltransferase Ste14